MSQYQIDVTSDQEQRPDVRTQNANTTIVFVFFCLALKRWLSMKMHAKSSYTYIYRRWISLPNMLFVSFKRLSYNTVAKEHLNLVDMTSILEQTIRTYSHNL